MFTKYDKAHIAAIAAALVSLASNLFGVEAEAATALVPVVTEALIWAAGAWGVTWAVPNKA